MREEYVSINKFSWWENLVENRVFVVVGLWYGAAEEVEFLELHQNQSITLPRAEFEDLIRKGKLKRIA